MTGAIIGSAVLGAASSASASSKASKSADAATAASSEAAANQLAFTKEQYEDWKATFGDVQDNLSAFYKSLTPDSFAASGIQSLNTQYAAASKKIDQALAQRGIAGSGLQAQAQTDLMNQQAQASAQIKAEAPLKVAQEQMKFLSLGLGQGTAAAASVGSAYGTQVNLGANQAAGYNAQAAQASAGIGSSLSSGINSYMSYNAMQNQSALLQTALGAGAGTSQLSQAQQLSLSNNNTAMIFG